ncbi:hypothetical protein ACWDUM_25495 [Rhodococcus sp. NPDC003322]
MQSLLNTDPSYLRRALNEDPEFRLQARYWSTTFRITEDDRSLLIHMTDGAVSLVDPGATPFDTWSFQLSGTAEHWAELLAPRPAAFYQDYYAAMLYHGFKIEGDMEQIMAHYPAIRRSLEVFRAVVRQEVAA